MKRPGRFGLRSIRSRLLALVLLPLAVVLPLLGAVLLLWSHEALDRLLITKVRSDLAVASGYFERVLAEVGASTSAIADSHALHLALAAPRRDAAVALLREYRERQGLDFINLRAPDGTLVCTDVGPAASGVGGEIAADIEEGTRVVVLQPAGQALLSPSLRERVPLPLVPTRGAAPTGRTHEDRAMVLLSTHPVLGPGGERLGLVQAGVLLNRNLHFIDRLNEIVYPEGALPFGSRGTATLFLEDVRISTNVRLFGDERAQRAIGTRVSQAVRDAVLGEGRTWLDRAFVVNDWYVSGYVPLADAAGQRVGMLYVGFTEAPFNTIKYGVLAAIGAVFFAVMIGAALVSLRWARAIFAPIERMAGTMQSVASGQLAARVGPVGTNDEIGQLAGHLDRLLDTIDGHTRALEAANATLDAKVAERTGQLQAAQTQLVRAEKLAAVGQLTAGIAHEVNNPIAVIQGSLDLVRELLGPDAERVKGELRLADEQLDRMRLIVTQLLQFARPNEFAGYVEPVDAGRLVDDSLLLVQHLLVRSRIELRREHTARGLPMANRAELQQVLVNLLVNALHAMPDGGELGITTRDVDGGAVEMVVTDTGPGLGPDLLRELFKPFVTRKKDGTGLGLWISRTIVERYGGELAAGDRTDGPRGAVFTIRLRTESTDSTVDG